MPERRFSTHTVELSRLDKILFPDSGITKGELIDYYLAIADVLLPHLRDRPLSLQRFPDGIDAEGFMQQQRPDYFPDWISACSTPRADGVGEPVVHVMCNGKGALAYLINQGTITLHGWPARASSLDKPDRIIFDLDPPGDSFEPVRQAARQVVALMQRLNLNPYLMTTGSRGLHVIAPLRVEASHDDVRALARDMASWLEARHGDTLTAAQRKTERRGRLYLDVSRNAYGQHTVMPYSVRARPDAPVATPLELDELEDPALNARRWRLRNIQRRMAQRRDPWSRIRRHATTLDRARRALTRIQDSD